MNKLVITGPNKAEFIKTDIPKINESQILVKTICTAISTGTEIRVYEGIPLIKTINSCFLTCLGITQLKMDILLLVK